MDILTVLDVSRASHLKVIVRIHHTIEILIFEGMNSFVVYAVWSDHGNDKDIEGPLDVYDIYVTFVRLYY